MKVLLVLILAFLILVPPALAQDASWTEQKGSNITFRLPPEWEAVSPARAEGEILAYERSGATVSRLNIVTLPMSGSVHLNDSFRRGTVQGIQNSGGVVRDSDIIDTAVGKAVWVRFAMPSSQVNGISFIIADETTGYKFTLWEADAITSQDQVLMEQIINTVQLENPRSESGSSSEAFEAGRELGRAVGTLLTICCCFVILPLVMIGALFRWRRNRQPTQPPMM